MSTHVHNKPCESCEHFDPVLRGQTGRGGLRETVWAWCAKRSIYPHYEGPGQRFPSEVQRAAPGALAKPFIVRKGQVVHHCQEYQERTPRMSKADLLKQIKSA